MEPTTPPPPQISPSRGNWWTRNWLWFVPTGCLTLLALFAVFIVSILMIVFGAMKSTDVYKDALARTRASAAVAEALGRPIKEGFFVSGSTMLMAQAANPISPYPSLARKEKGLFTSRRKKRWVVGNILAWKCRSRAANESIC